MEFRIIFSYKENINNEIVSKVDSSGQVKLSEVIETHKN